MSKLGEKTLIQHLTDADSLDVLVRSGFGEYLIPTEALRPLVLRAIDIYHDSGRLKAPSEAVLRTEFGDLLDDHELVLDEPEASIEWAIEDLKGFYAQAQFASFNRKSAVSMSEAPIEDKTTVIREATTELVRLSMSLESQERTADIRTAMAERLTAYDARTLDRGAIRGLRFGLEQIDAYTGGIHPGELAILAGPAKQGKSFLVDRVALEEWRSGKPTVIMTLENSVEMTLDRMAAFACGISLKDYMHGTMSESDRDLVAGWVDDLTRVEVPLWVISPDVGQRSFEAMVYDALARGADSLIIDQLTHVELPSPRKPKHERIGEALHSLKAMISTGRKRLPVLLAHQVNREGVDSADKVGYLKMRHMAESAEVERTADWVFGLYQTRDQEASLEALFQTLASRRAKTKNFNLGWSVNTGHVRVRGEVVLGGR